MSNPVGGFVNPVHPAFQPSRQNGVLHNKA